MLNHINDCKGIALSDLCRNATKIDGDEFVGIKFDWNAHESKFDISIVFPIGYRIGIDNETIRSDIISLISLLTEYGDNKSTLPHQKTNSFVQYYSFPIQAYMNIIYDFLDRGRYYTEEDETYTRGNGGRVSWSRTIRHERPIIQKKGIAYLTMQVRKRNDTDKNLITEISKYCVYDSFLKLGWLYGYNLPPKPAIKFNKNIFLSVLREKLAITHKDRDKRLIKDMLDIVSFVDTTEESEQDFYFGTYKFEYIWENLIDDIFGIKEKSLYFPKSTWTLFYSNNKENRALLPDTILREEDIAVLDAKYYRYGETRAASHLPSSSSINKQITYGEYIFNNHKDEGDIYNAFIMPFRRNNEFFNTELNYLAIGVAKSDWKKNDQYHELVLGVLADVKHLMSVRVRPNNKEIHELLSIIRKAVQQL